MASRLFGQAFGAAGVGVIHPLALPRIHIIRAWELSVWGAGGNLFWAAGIFPTAVDWPHGSRPCRCLTAAAYICTTHVYMGGCHSLILVARRWSRSGNGKSKLRAYFINAVVFSASCAVMVCPQSGSRSGLPDEDVGIITISGTRHLVLKKVRLFFR